MHSTTRKKNRTNVTSVFVEELTSYIAFMKLLNVPFHVNNACATLIFPINMQLSVLCSFQEHATLYHKGKAVAS
jgi:hypothetical protein